MLLTFQEYTEMGFDSVSETDFPKYESEAESYLEYITFNKVNRNLSTDVENKAKRAMALVIDILFDYSTKLQSINESDAKIIASGLKSESIKSHSVSFRDATSDSQTELLKATEINIYSTLRRILLPTGILYRGL